MRRRDEQWIAAYHKGREIVGRSIGVRAFVDGVTIQFTQPYRPAGLVYIQLFNCKLRDECEYAITKRKKKAA